MIRSIHTNFSKDVPVSTYGDCGATLTTVIDGEQKINIFSFRCQFLRSKINLIFDKFVIV